MSAFDDDDDWVGTPPEGRHSRERADPGYWRRQPFLTVSAAILALLVLALVVIALLR